MLVDLRKKTKPAGAQRRRVSCMPKMGARPDATQPHVTHPLLSVSNASDTIHLPSILSKANLFSAE
jgi:hypothetical protein